MYIVVENAGYANERDIKAGKDWHALRRWMSRTYTVEERDDLHVDIAKILPDGTRTYEY